MELDISKTFIDIKLFIKFLFSLKSLILFIEIENTA